LLERFPQRRPEIRATMARRIRKVLAVAALYGSDALVLGAWGCGVFRNDPAEIAELFRQALAGEFKGIFARVVFAVVDWSDEERFIGPFKKTFAPVAAIAQLRAGSCSDS
jgi:uncharacterized protein (TIGR02452 family)